ncbi:hypothetical protein C8J57DRAFT_1344025 [Mycena rebaudengoi]|nr:hypothetical protein C8J57DRAFT_1344025 [Mycena rebaudengoi]
MENDDFTSNSAGDHPECSSASYHDSGFFPGSHHFTVAGGTFNNITKNYTSAPTVPSDFRMIPLGDIDLQREIRLHKLEGSLVVDRRRERASVRRVYSARVDGRNALTTVAMYQGPRAEEEWRQDIAKHRSIRHPTIVQMCGAASSGDVHATFYHGDLIPFQHFLDLHRHSPVLTVYIQAFCFAEFSGLREYFFSTFQTSLYEEQCTFWIRRSTGRLCADLIPSNLSLSRFSSHERPTLDLWQGMFSLNTPHMEAKVIDSLTLQQFHAICRWDLAQWQMAGISTPVTVHFGALLVTSGSDSDYLNEVVSSSYIRIHSPHWKTFQDWADTSAPGAQGQAAEDGWTRFNSGDVSDNLINLRLNLRMEQHSESWLSQANHIFGCLGITSDYADYALVQDASLNVTISEALEPPPQGYLFVCPEKDLQIGPSSFRLPDCPAYWSLDPSGAERLNPEEAAELGFPSIELNTTIFADSWSADVYAGLRQFHRAKGFDPDSQDVAQHLGYSLYQLPRAVDPLFAHVDDADVHSEEDDQVSVDIDTWGENINQVHKSTNASEEPGPPSLHDEMPVSRTFRFFMNIQGTLFLFLALSWLYDPWL